MIKNNNALNGGSAVANTGSQADFSYSTTTFINNTGVYIINADQATLVVKPD